MKCRNCQTEFYSNFCPNCGFSARENESIIGNEVNIKNQVVLHALSSNVKLKKKSKTKAIIFGLIVTLLLLFLFIFSLNDFVKDNAPPEVVPDVNLYQIVTVRDENPLRAEEEFVGEWFIFKGYLRTAVNDRFYIEHPYLSQKVIIRCEYFNSGVKDYVVGLDIGDPVQVQGRITDFGFTDLSVHGEKVCLELNVVVTDIEDWIIESK